MVSEISNDLKPVRYIMNTNLSFMVLVYELCRIEMKLTVGNICHNKLKRVRLKRYCVFQCF